MLFDHHQRFQELVGQQAGCSVLAMLGIIIGVARSLR